MSARPGPTQVIHIPVTDQKKENKLIAIIVITIVTSVVAIACTCLFYFKRRLSRRYSPGKGPVNGRHSGIELCPEDAVLTHGLVANELYLPIPDGGIRFIIKCDEKWEIRREW